MFQRLTFLGGVGTVTGSKFLVSANGSNVLVDCGLFQGYKQLRLRNRKPLAVMPSDIDAVVLTHAHIDHSGYLPLLVKNGFTGHIHCTDATEDLCKILLRDSGYLQEREADRANRYGYSKHEVALPLYDQKDAVRALEHFCTHDFHQHIRLPGNISVKFMEAGHILGAAIVELIADDTKIVFSGDLGRSNNPIMHDPEKVDEADYLIVESTYGDRKHTDKDPEDALEDVINRTAARGGVVLIPAFAVGRSQSILYHIHQLKLANRISDIPVFLDSPMAINASELFWKHAGAHKLSEKQAKAVCNSTTYVRTAEESKGLDKNGVPKIILSASGMATGGRILHHLKRYVGDARNTVLFSGFQAGGTRGAKLVEGVSQIKIHGSYHPVKAEVSSLSMLSAHADSDEIMNWLSGFKTPPKQTFIVHGEPAAADELRHRIEEELHWACTVPEQGEQFDLS